MSHEIKRVALLFAGGPAPAANAVISTAATSFLRHGIQVIGVLHGYENLQEYGPDHPMLVGRDYTVIEHRLLRRTRNSQGIMIGTARANPGRSVSHPDHLRDADRVAPLRRTYEALCSLDVNALVSIGGDDTLKTANKFKMFQDQLPEDSHKIPVVHVPKTIDNDYSGIDFTFGFFTAVDSLGTAIRNVLHDAEASGSYFVTESMGRSAGWLAYGAAMSGEASMVMSVEDITGELEGEEETEDPETGEVTKRRIMNVERVIDQMLRVILNREKDRKRYGVIVIAEGLAEMLPMSYLEGIPRDDHGHISITHINLYQLFARLLAERYELETGRKKKITGIQLGYESRCAKPSAFDVMLGSQLGVGAYRALIEENLNGVMVSVQGQLDLLYVPFEELVDQETLVTKVRFIERGSDFYRLARFLESYVNE